LILKCALESGLQQYVDSPTRKLNVLDLVLCNDPMLILSLTVENPISDVFDHNTVLFEIDFSCQTICSLPSFDYTRTDYLKMNSLLYDKDWNTLFSPNMSVDDCYNCLLAELIPVIKSSTPLKRRRFLPFDWPNFVQHLQNEKRRLWRKRHEPGGATAYSKCAKNCRLAIERVVKNRESALINSGNVKKLYSYINGQLKSKSGVSPLKDTDGALCVNDVDKASTLQSTLVIQSCCISCRSTESVVVC
jgi:hypothetical protein